MIMLKNGSAAPGLLRWPRRNYDCRYQSLDGYRFDVQQKRGRTKCGPVFAVPVFTGFLSGIVKVSLDTFLRRFLEFGRVEHDPCELFVRGKLPVDHL